MMSFLRLNLLKNFIILSNKIIFKQQNIYCNNYNFARHFSVTIANNYCVEKNTDTNATNEEINTTTKDPLKDRSKSIPVETSIKYLKSEAYKTTYGDKLVWEQYRRNYKGQIAPRRTRRTCIRKGVISTGSPCPICRDEYLVLDHRNLELLQQFISPHTGQIISYSKTGLCQVKHRDLIVAIERAKDFGFITYDVPFRTYEYSDYYDREALKLLEENK